MYTETKPQQDVLLLIERIREGDHGAEAELFTLTRRGLKLLCLREAGDGADDLVHDLWAAVVPVIRDGGIADAGALIANARKAAGPLVAAVAGRRVFSTREESRQSAQLRVDKLTAREREILARFYVRGQSDEQICVAMGADVAEIRAARLRAKALLRESWDMASSRRPESAAQEQAFCPV